MTVAQHAHVVGPGAVHAAAGAAPPEVAPAYHDGHFHAHIHQLFHRLADVEHRVEIDAVAGLARQGLAR